MLPTNAFFDEWQIYEYHWMLKKVGYIMTIFSSNLMLLKISAATLAKV